MDPKVLLVEQSPKFLLFDEVTIDDTFQKFKNKSAKRKKQSNHGI